MNENIIIKKFPMLVVKIKKILTIDEKRERRKGYKQNFINSHFNGDIEAYRLYMTQSVKALYHDPTKNYKETNIKLKLTTYYKKKEEMKEALKVL